MCIGHREHPDEDFVEVYLDGHGEMWMKDREGHWYAIKCLFPESAPDVEMRLIASFSVPLDFQAIEE